MEHPHNAVLLKCASYEMGCRPYMCNTSYRHSNCLDQFCKSDAPYLSSEILQEIPLTSTPSHRSQNQSQPGHIWRSGSQLQPKLACPLCRGEIYGYVVLDPARKYMNAKPRSCSAETCDFCGTYSELRKHARSEHPAVRPSVVDPTRQREWTRLERERDFEDILSSIQAGVDEESAGDNTLSAGNREQSHTRTSGRMSREPYDADTHYRVRQRSTLSQVHDPDRNYAAGQRTNFSLVRDADTNHASSRWSTNLSSDRTRHSRQYRHELSRVPLSERIRHRQHLQEPNQRWSYYNNQP
ncbi:Protein of unknown function (DUF1644) [Quillaja saponaria]|nr:Protein of unknown function (DUF1644) [Quillaja saponaria]